MQTFKIYLHNFAMVYFSMYDLDRKIFEQTLDKNYYTFNFVKIEKFIMIAQYKLLLEFITFFFNQISRIIIFLKYIELKQTEYNRYDF